MPRDNAYIGFELATVVSFLQRDAVRHSMHIPERILNPQGCPLHEADDVPKTSDCC